MQNNPAFINMSDVQLVQHILSLLQSNRNATAALEELYKRYMRS